MCIDGNKEEVTRDLYNCENLSAVIYIKSADKPHKSEKGNGKLPHGIIKSCKWRFEWVNTFNKNRLKGVDKRHEVFKVG
jgi:hypothetical protein